MAVCFPSLPLDITNLKETLEFRNSFITFCPVQLLSGGYRFVMLPTFHNPSFCNPSKTFLFCLFYQILQGQGLSDFLLLSDSSLHVSLLTFQSSYYKHVLLSDVKKKFIILKIQMFININFTGTHLDCQSGTSGILTVFFQNAFIWYFYSLKEKSTNNFDAPLVFTGCFGVFSHHFRLKEHCIGYH